MRFAYSLLEVVLHDGTRIVQLVHRVEVGNLRYVDLCSGVRQHCVCMEVLWAYQIDNCEVFNILCNA